MRLFVAMSAGLMAWMTLLGADAPAKFPAGGMTFTRPATWTWVETTSPMRKAQLGVPGIDGKAGGEVIFFHFGQGGGGGAKANVDRWLGQFQEKGDALKSKIEEVTVRGKQVTFVRAQGTYLSGMPGGPKTPQPDTMLLGAIVDGPEGSVFIRFTGPTALGAATEAEFRKLAESGIP